jgi:hypothetical protein
MCNSRQQAVFRDIEKQRLSGTRTARCIQDYRQPELFSAMNYKRTLPPSPPPPNHWGSSGERERGGGRGILDLLNQTNFSRAIVSHLKLLENKIFGA